MKLAIVAAQFNKQLVDAMVVAAREEALAAGAEIIHEVGVSGCYEVPLLAASLLAKKNVDAVVVIGYIEHGETLHGEVMGHVVHRALVDLEIANGKPIGIGIIGPGATAEQAEQRKDGYARAAMRAALASLQALAQLDRSRKGRKKS